MRCICRDEGLIFILAENEGITSESTSIASPATAAAFSFAFFFLCSWDLLHDLKPSGFVIGTFTFDQPAGRLKLSMTESVSQILLSIVQPVKEELIANRC